MKYKHFTFFTFALLLLCSCSPNPSGDTGSNTNHSLNESPIAWTMGDSIFDLRDNHTNDLVQTILKNAGIKETNMFMDNHSGYTVASYKGFNGIVDNINNGQYSYWAEMFGDPDLIIIQRGTNDCYWHNQNPNLLSKTSYLEAVSTVSNYFLQNWPQARIVWATPLWRVDVPTAQLDEYRENLHSKLDSTRVEVFDLHSAGSFRELNTSNYYDLLVDGVHLNDAGVQEMIRVFNNFLGKIS